MDDLAKDIDEKVDCSESEELITFSYVQDALKNLPEVLGFIQRLQECIERQRTLLHKLYKKLREGNYNSVLTSDASTQTNDNSTKEWTTGNIVEVIKEAAESAQQQTGFVYEATSGMYYDYNTGYYYNAEMGLYYDGQSGTYYYFDESSKSFQYHSQVTTCPSTFSVESHNVIYHKSDSNKREPDITTSEIPKKIKQDLKEEGECSESSSENESETNNDSVKVILSSDTNRNNIDIKDNNTKADVENILLDVEVANAWPPCLRVVVKETKLENLLVGSLFIITCTGGTLGREGDHSIVIPDINISKHHAKVSFNDEGKCYNIVDLGSRNGTFVDGKRISVALRESEPVALRHGTIIKVGTTHLECHLHQGRETCTECEPGCTLQKQTDRTLLTDKDHETREARHRSELRRLRKRFGLDKLSAKETTTSLAPGYQDRAEERRKTVGSTDHSEKTETASVHESIQSSNKGFKMLSKMGWSKGQSLGKDSTRGITEPVTVEQRPEKAGLGSDLVHLPAPNPKVKKKTEVWKKAQKRFQELADDDE